MAQDQNGAPESTKHYYPPPEATYEEVASNAGLFMGTLERLHRCMGTKFIVPTIGGKALNLHLLFVEVTSRGGLEKVISDRTWRDVIAVFSFPSTITSASYVLRKYYISLLHHYEQVYFFRSRKPGIPLAASVPAGKALYASVASRSQVATTPAQVSQPQVATTPAQVKGNKIYRLPVTANFPLQDGRSVVGKITGKFDYGYLVTANLGSERLRGVLYHVPVGKPELQASSHLLDRRCSRKRSRKAMKDPFRPKSNRSGYNFFFAEQYARLKPLHSGEERAISKEIGYLWNKLTTAEKEVYQDKGVQDKERYRSEMLEYKKSSNTSLTN